ncbi:uncharacterized protein [Populus alba]|uniref:uncharacterized protein n=1 Tax=Populus alba TaxID=43335 RepID=UPI00158AE901|nr:uncharacterized protein LOC118027700 [Populus alba]
MASFGSLKPAIFEREEIKQFLLFTGNINLIFEASTPAIATINFERLRFNYGKGKSTHEKLLVEMDRNALREGYQLVRSEEDDMDTSYERRLVKRFYDKLLKSILCEWMLFNGLKSIVTPTSEIHLKIP